MIIIYESIIFFIYVGDLILIYFINEPEKIHTEIFFLNFSHWEGCAY